MKKLRSEVNVRPPGAKPSSMNGQTKHNGALWSDRPPARGSRVTQMTSLIPFVDPDTGSHEGGNTNADHRWCFDLQRWNPTS
ncbi:unnamed protein product [Boreogadus saida]